MSALFSVPTLTYGIPGSFDVAPGGFCASYARRLNLGLKTGVDISHTVGIRIPTVWQPDLFPAPNAVSRPATT